MRKLPFYIILLLAGLHTGSPLKVYAQLSPSLYDYPHNRLPWYTIESPHFLVHFQKGDSRAGKVASRIAEEVYPDITTLYGQIPDEKVNIVLKNRQDYSNGAAYFFDNQIDIWIPTLNSPLRGTHNWMRDAITHEFTHIVQLQASMKKNRHIPAIYLQWLSYENVRRPDVLYGYPKGIITHPFASISVPAWFAEGTAQFQRQGWLFDTWDTYRDMVLRTAVLNDTYLSLEDMGTFSSKNSLEREKVYNQGFAFVIWLVQHYGESVLPKISHAFSKPGIFTADKALQVATGTSGHDLFSGWIKEQKTYYQKAVAPIQQTQSHTIEPRGFFNFYPSYAPGGSRIAYLSNKGSVESGVSLYIVDGNDMSKDISKIRLNAFEQGTHFSCGFSQKPAIEHIRSSYSFSPDGQSILYSRTRLNKYGEQYSDLFIYSLKSGKSRQITHSQRLWAPAWQAKKNQAVAVQQQEGTANLVLVDLSKETITPLTTYSHGEQVYEPVWHPDGNIIYFSFSKDGSRSIKKINLQEKRAKTVIGEPYIDYRNPFIDEEGLFLYYASDEDGIFNIYRMPVGGGAKEKLTNVAGGAFMPSVNQYGRMLFSSYRKGGYKIVTTTLNKTSISSVKGRYSPPYPEYEQTDSMQYAVSPLNDFDDSDIEPFTPAVIKQADSMRVPFRLPGREDSQNRSFYAYKPAYTDFSFYPVVRFDNYSKKYGSNSHLIRSSRWGDLGKNLIRDLKLGAYFSSREVTGRLSIFGGALFGFGSRPANSVTGFFKPSRLTDLDRDLFLITEYRGLPFIKKRWSPTVSLELYNMRRNVSNGLSIEEFPCTACLPDTLNTDLAYNIWEANLYLRSKIDAHNMIELGAGYTPYKVQTEGFYSQELRQFIPSSSSEYFKGTTFSASHVFEQFVSYKNADIAPIGLRSYFRYAYESGKLLDDYKIKDGSISPVYKSTDNYSVELSERFGFRVNSRTTAMLFGRFFTYLNNPGDSFYSDYIGGFTGMRSYPYFALGGNTTAFGQFSYILPLVTNLHTQVGRYTLDKLFLRFFGEAGTTWESPLKTGSALKIGIGTELRVAFNSYYLFPLKLFISSAYGFQKFRVKLPEAFITESGNNEVHYGRELLFHFGLTFDFDILNHD